MLNCNRISDTFMDRSNKSLIKGAISPIQDFLFSNIKEEVGYTAFQRGRDMISAFLPVDTEIRVDLENRIFVSNDGVVCDAYDLSKYSDEEIAVLSRVILASEEMKHPGYEYVIKKGIFPINVNGSYTKYGEIEHGITPNMSTHILYLTNYKDFLPKTKKLVR